MEKGVPVRSVSRSLSILQVVNRGGGLSLVEIAQAAEIPYATACRLVQTLVVEGMLERPSGSKRYRPTAMVQTLSAGFRDRGGLPAEARAAMADLTRQILWPVLAVSRVGASMVVRESTTGMTSLSFTHYVPGHAFPLLSSASGKACLAFSEEAERDVILDSIAARGPRTAEAVSAFKSSGALSHIRAAGYALSRRNGFTSTPGKTSSLAVPILNGGRFEAALTVVFFTTAVTPGDFIERFLGPVLDTAAQIGDRLAVAGRA